LLLLAEEESKVQWPSDREKKATDGGGRFVMLGAAV
jgi:hypothetical protein